MTYEETLEFLFSSLPMYQRVGKAAYKSDLSNSLAFDVHLRCPHRSYATVHVAGTNGKGTVSNALASVLQEAGYSVGLFTSPHLVDFRERIRVNGQMVDKDFVTAFVRDNYDFISDLKPSFFEMTSAMALDYFRHANVDVAVVEVGMGGRLDSTNVISPVLSVITNIAFDHTQFLGDTLAKIAGEKGGIIKPNTPVVVGESSGEYDHVFVDLAGKNHASLTFADKLYSAKLSSTEADYGIYAISDCNTTSYVKFGLVGKYQEKNLTTILVALSCLRAAGFALSDEHVAAGLLNVCRNTHFHGRWEVLRRRPLVVCDIAHNAHGLSYIVQQVNSLKHSHLRYVLGFVNDKDLDSILSLFPVSADYYFTQPSIPRAKPVAALQCKAAGYGLQGGCFATVAEAYRAALSQSSPDDVIYVGGSTFVVADLFAMLGRG